MPENAFEFEPPRRSEMWRRLALTMSQASSLTGVSERQIQHWMDRGYIVPSTEGSRKLNGPGLDQVVLIRQARAAGIPLRRAVHMAHEYLEREAAGDLDARGVPVALRDLGSQLATLRNGIDSVQSILEEMDGSVRSGQSLTLPGRKSNRV